MYKLKKKGDVISPAKNLYVIIPPEHQRNGCLPADELVPLLMKHWNIDYYVCLLSAASYYGAAHQKPHVFQVMTNKQLKPLVLGEVKIDFVYKKKFINTQIQKVTVKTGYLNVSSPELTAMDLLLYLHQAGGLNHVATVLNELIETIDPEKMIALIQNSKQKNWIQRLGYILEHIEPMEMEKRNRLVAQMLNFIERQPLGFVPLAAELPTKNVPRNKRWKIVENTTIESDI
jgi:predicted transcriptional regulator of viral defense system